MGGLLGGVGKVLFGQSGVGPSINLFNKLSLQQQQMLNNAVGLGQLGINQIQGGFDKARTAVTQAKGVATTDAKDAATQAYGATANSAVSRGLTNTSTLDAANRGVGSDLAKHIAWIDANAGQQTGALDIGQANAMNQGYQGLGQLYTQFGQNNAALAGPLMAQIGQGQPGILGPLLQTGGMMAAMSDPRLKKNIEFEGMIHTKDGKSIPTYTFEYKDPNLPGRYHGVMSTDVKMLKGVVKREKTGYDSVDYLKLYDLTGFTFKKLGEKAAV